jgi:hypothetical protein
MISWRLVPEAVAHFAQSWSGVMWRVNQGFSQPAQSGEALLSTRRPAAG